MRPISLSDEQMDAVFAASHPIAPDRRSAFLVDVATELARLPTVGDGTCFRIIAAMQKRYFDPPIETERGHRRTGHGKYAGVG